MGIVSAIFFILYGVFKILKSFFVKYLTHGVILGFQFAFTASSIVVVVGFVLFSITALVGIYNQIQDLINYISTANTGALSCFFSVLECSGALLAINNGITLIFGAISTVALFHLAKFLIYGLKFIGNELFKLGVLLGQAVN